MTAIRPRRLVPVMDAVGIVATSLLVLGVPGPALAASIGRVDVCAHGNYSGEAQIPAFGNVETEVAVPGGTCTSIAESVNTELEVKIIGNFNTSSNTFLIGTFDYNPSDQGVTIDLEGTTANDGSGASAVLKISTAS
jgi:hypothetical protein